MNMEDIIKAVGRGGGGPTCSPGPFLESVACPEALWLWTGESKGYGVSCEISARCNGMGAGHALRLTE